MLVLSRKEGEKLLVGENITIVISKISGNRVTIGIEAPRDVKVVRGELERQVAAESNVAGDRSAELDRIAVVERERISSESQVFHLRLKIDNEMVALQKDVG
jgi:carbon storage regulator CsrA